MFRALRCVYHSTLGWTVITKNGKALPLPKIPLSSNLILRDPPHNPHPTPNTPHLTPRAPYPGQRLCRDDSGHHSSRLEKGVL